MQTASKVIGAMKTEGLAVPSVGRDTIVAPGAAARIAAAALGITPGSPVLITRTRYHAADGTLIEYAETTAPAGHWHTREYAITGN
jgi:DNA-binding GntR family transcriptional regulator